LNSRNHPVFGRVRDHLPVQPFFAAGPNAKAVDFDGPGDGSSKVMERRSALAGSARRQAHNLAVHHVEVDIVQHVQHAEPLVKPLDAD
jgi:hypothetical protein